MWLKLIHAQTIDDVHHHGCVRVYRVKQPIKMCIASCEDVRNEDIMCDETRINFYFNVACERACNTHLLYVCMCVCMYVAGCYGQASAPIRLVMFGNFQFFFCERITLALSFHYILFRSISLPKRSQSHAMAITLDVQLCVWAYNTF